MSSASKKAARASLILVLGATSAIPAVAALTGNDEPPTVVASAASAETTQQLADQILGRNTGETVSFAREGNGGESTRRENRQARRLERRALDAYFDAGYDDDHAVELAEYWGYGDDVYSAKITKGKFILGTIEFPPPAETHEVDLQQQALDAYFDAGYDYDDAVALAEWWGYGDDVYSAKITKGKVLLGVIDFPPQVDGPEVDLQQQALDAYFDAGYDYDHAVELADYWGYGDDVYSAKITKGKFILGTIEFPPPAETHEVDLQQQALDAYFDAGYDYDDAVILAEYWGYEDAYSAKITKGKVLLGVIDFPAQVEESDAAEGSAEDV